MPRLGLAVNEDFSTRVTAGKPDRFGRRVRHVAGVATHKDPSEAVFVNPFFVKLALWLATAAFIGMTIALWRLFSFPH
jgi:hypothetical protein